VTEKQLKEAFAELRDEAHKLSQEKLASGEADKARLTRARELRSRLDELIAENSQAAKAVQDENSDIAAIANRYLLFVLPPEAPATEQSFEAAARELHSRVITAARRVASDALKGEALATEVSKLRESFTQLLARPERKESGLDSLFGDIQMDLVHLQNAGRAPTSLRLARELRE
jgi:aspartate carbamoyltransferase catalytic subunit